MSLDHRTIDCLDNHLISLNYRNLRHSSGSCICGGHSFVSHLQHYSLSVYLGRSSSAFRCRRCAAIELVHQVASLYTTFTAAVLFFDMDHLAVCFSDLSRNDRHLLVHRQNHTDLCHRTSYRVCHRTARMTGANTCLGLAASVDSRLTYAHGRKHLSFSHLVLHQCQRTLSPCRQSSASLTCRHASFVSATTCASIS